MKITPDTLSMPGLNAAAAVVAKNRQEPAQPQVPETAEIQPEASGDADRLKDAVARLQAQPDIRPEVVAAKKASDPAAVPTDAQLAQFISALKQDV